MLWRSTCVCIYNFCCVGGGNTVGSSKALSHGSLLTLILSDSSTMPFLFINLVIYYRFCPSIINVFFLSLQVSSVFIIQNTIEGIVKSFDLKLLAVSIFFSIFKIH